MASTAAARAQIRIGPGSKREEREGCVGPVASDSSCSMPPAGYIIPPTRAVCKNPRCVRIHVAALVAIRVMLDIGSISAVGLEAEVGDSTVAVKVSLVCHCIRWVVRPHVLAE